jgi:hypothetical protein
MIWAGRSRLCEWKDSMISKKDIADLPVANYDSDRKGIFIHVKVGKQDLFAISIVKNDKGDIVFDKNGIFIERTRRIDILLGGIFNEYILYFESDPQRSIKLRPLEAVIKNNYM